MSSDFVVLIKTEQTYYSEWVLREIEMARRYKIPILEFEYDELIDKKFLPITQCIHHAVLSAD